METRAIAHFKINKFFNEIPKYKFCPSSCTNAKPSPGLTLWYKTNG